MTDQFAKDISKGLSKYPKRLSSKYFYDTRGSELFVEIMNMPEYYLTRAELDIFSNKTNQLISMLGVSPNKNFKLIELGAGDGAKTIHLLQSLVRNGYSFSYHPIDISKSALDTIEKRINKSIPELNYSLQHGDYFTILKEFKSTPEPKIILFLGSNLGNLSDQESSKFLKQLSANLNKEDKILLGLDLIKSRDIVLPAYNDSQGITAAFNLNLLQRINRELDADFDLDNFEHRPSYDPSEGIARSYLQSKCDQTVHIKALNQTVEFKKGEKLQTEMSRKYNNEILNDIINGSGLKIVSRITDNQNLFADYLIASEK